MAAPAIRVPAPGVRIGLPMILAVVVASYGAGSVVLAVLQDRPTSYVAASPVALVLGLVAATSLLAVGTVLVVAGDRERWGVLAVALGVVWLAPVWWGWEAGPSWLRSTAALLPGLAVALLVHLWLLGSRGARAGALAPAVHAVVGGLVVGRAVVHDPHRDRYCWVDCGIDANAFLVRSDLALARGLEVARLGLVVALAAAVALLTAVAVARGRERVGLPVTVATAAALMAEAAYAVTLVVDPAERFGEPLGTALFLLRSLAALAVAAAVLWTGARARLMRRRVAALARELDRGPGTGAVEGHLARSLGRPGLRIDYWSSLEGRYVDAAGHPVADDPSPAPAASTRVMRGGHPVAVIRHGGGPSVSRALAEHLGPAAHVVIDNERLRAERLAQVAELRRSRARIAVAADEHRRQLERDLHDGAQQRLISATFELRLAAAEAEAAGDPTAPRLRRAVEEAVAVLSDLRDFAHGVFPAVLDEAGLEEALWSLAEGADRPVELEVRLDGRRARATERAAYLVARSAVDGATDPVVLRVTDAEGELVVEAEGVGEIDGVHLADRVGAVGGELEVAAGRLRAVLP